MLHIHRLPLIFTICCMGLSACAPAAPLPTATPLPSATLTPTEIPPMPTETLTPVPTETPTPTETPAKTVDLDINGDGVTDYVGTIKESHNIEINEGETARQDKIRTFVNSDFNYAGFDTQYGYLTGYDIVTINNGERDLDLVFFRVKYFREGKPPITVEFSATKKVLSQNGFNGESSLRTRVNINCTTPNGNDFTNKLKTAGIKNNELDDFEASIIFPENTDWIGAYEALRLLKDQDITHLDLKFKLISSQMSQ